jgi:hypothetical protein
MAAWKPLWMKRALSKVSFPSAAIANTDVEKAIRSEVQITAVVVASRIELRDERLLHAVVEARHALMEPAARCAGCSRRRSAMLRAKSG